MSDTATRVPAGSIVITEQAYADMIDEMARLSRERDAAEDRAIAAERRADASLDRAAAAVLDADAARAELAGAYTDGQRDTRAEIGAALDITGVVSDNGVPTLALIMHVITMRAAIIDQLARRVAAYEGHARRRRAAARAARKTASRGPR